MGLFSSCLTSKKNEHGLFVYDYCVAREGKESVLISNSYTLTHTDEISISGTVADLRTHDLLFGVPVELSSKTKLKKQILTTDTNGHFSFKVPKEEYVLTVKFIGYQDFTSNVTSKQNSLMEIGMGEPNAFVTYGITSKKRLTKGQLKFRVLKLSNKE